jgi:NAD+ kinase
MTGQYIPRKYTHICFIADKRLNAKQYMKKLIQQYGQADIHAADVIVVLGGDGCMLHTLQQTLNTGTPVYGINFGSVGFLMNRYRPDDLSERLEQAVPTVIHPLQMHAETLDGHIVSASAINEVSLLRQTHQAAKIRIVVDRVVRLDELIADGVLVATPAGSTAYNLSVYGPILPIGSNLLALTPISAFRPRRWRGALLDHRSHIRFEVLMPKTRPVSATADSTEVRDITAVDIQEDHQKPLTLLFDADHVLNERILQEQFLQLP